MPTDLLQNVVIERLTLSIRSREIISLCRQIPGCYLKLGHDSFLPHPSPFIIYFSPVYWTPYNLNYWKSIVKYTTTTTTIITTTTTTIITTTTTTTNAASYLHVARRIPIICPDKRFEVYFQIHLPRI
jgi:hypothetical protein